MKKRKKRVIIALTGACIGGLACGRLYRQKKQAVCSNTVKSQEQLEAKGHRQGFYEKYIKRPQDFCCAFAAIVILSPVMAVTALLVRLKLGSPVIFKQERPGLNEKIFTLYKFRTMTDEKDDCGNLLPDDIRLTKFGKMLRSTSLDELPELLNILKGDMAVVGPRPLLVRDMVFMTKEQRKRHSIRPGLTGLAQVNGRNNITWEQKLKYDLNYINSGISFCGDMKLIIQTVIKVIKRNDIIREGTSSDVDFGDWLLNEGNVTQKEYDKKQEEARKLLRR